MALKPRPTFQCASKRFLRRILRERAVEAKQIGGTQNGAVFGLIQADEAVINFHSVSLPQQVTRHLIG